MASSELLISHANQFCIQLTTNACFFIYLFVLGRVIYTDEDGDSDEDSWRFMANARRASLGLSLMHRSQPSANEGRDRIALDISLLKKQYAKLRERQKQAHIILSNAARQTVNPGMNNTSQLSVNKYLAGRNAIVSNKGKRIGPPAGSIPPIRNATTITNTNTMVPALVKPSKNAAKPPKRIRSSSMDEPTDNEKHSKSTTNHSNEQQSSTVLHQRLQRTASSASSISDGASTSATQAPPPRHRLRRESSSYSEDDSDHEMLDDNSDDSSSSTSTSLCDDVDEPCVSSSVDASPLKKRPSTSASNYGALSDDSASSMSNLTERIDQLKQNQDAIVDDICSQPTISIDVVHDHNDDVEQTEEPDIHPMSTDADDDYVPPHDGSVQIDDSVCGNVPQISANLNTYEKELLEEALNLPQQITSTSQLSPIADIAEYLRYSCISPLKSPVSLLYLGFDQDSDEQNYSGQLGAEQAEQSEQSFKVDEDGVTNEYFERVNQVPAEYGVMEADETAAEIAPHVIAESDSLYSDKAFKMSEPCLEDDGGTSQQASNIFMKWEIENKHTPSDYECDSNEQIISCDDNDELKEATVESSIDMTTTTNDSEPTDDSSPPEESTENPDSNKNTEKVLQMIAENSVILHRIMNHDEREEDVRNVNEIIDNQSNVLIGEQFVQNDAMASIDSKFIADRISAMYSSVSRVLGKWNEYDVDDESRNKNVPVNMDMLEWHRDHFMNDDMPDCDEVLSIEQNDSPTKSIDHIVNSDSDYTVRNVSVNSDIMDKEDTVREIDDYLCEIVKSSDVQEPVVTHDHNSANFDDGNLVMNELEEVELSPIRKPESRFTKYINDVAAGLVFDDDPMPSIYHSDSMSTGINHNTAAISEPESVNLPDIGTYLSGSVETAPSSIENAFKFIDTFSAGNRNPSDDSRDRDKQLEILIRAAENIDRAKGISSERSRPVSLIDTTSAPRDIKPLSSVESSERNERYLSLPRCSRDRWRDPSPRRRIKQDADFVEYESRARRDKSPSVDPTPLYSSYSNIRFKDDTHEYKYDTDINPSSSSPQSFGSSSNSYCSSKNVEIRPVTLTFYDRFLSQKRERRIRMDKSPSSPVITKAYLDSLKPDYRDSYSRKDRNTRSAENSPSRKKNSFHFESTIDQSVTSQSESTMSNYPVYSQYPAADKYTKSCDNIPFNIDNRNNKSYKFDYSNSSEYSKTDVTQTKYTPMTQSLSMRTKSPSEWEKKFGLYGADGTSNT